MDYTNFYFSIKRFLTTCGEALLHTSRHEKLGVSSLLGLLAVFFLIKPRYKETPQHQIMSLFGGILSMKHNKACFFFLDFWP